MEIGLTLIQRVVICFAAGVIGGLAVVLFSHVLFGLGLGAAFGVKAPISLKSPDLYRPLFWAGLWGIPFGLFIKIAWTQLYLFGLLYFLAPLRPPKMFGFDFPIFIWPNDFHRKSSTREPCLCRRVVGAYSQSLHR